MRRLFAACLVPALAVCAAAQNRAPAPAQAPAIVQPGAPGQPSHIVGRVPTYHDNTFIPADVQFMQGMVDHHNQALQMVALIPAHTTTPELVELGRKIQISQSGEIAYMQDWLRVRGQPVPSLMPGGGGVMLNGQMMMAMPGMLSPAQMQALKAAHGATFDRLFLTGMIAHHTGALNMVADLRAAGGAQEPNLFDFIMRVDTDQRMEITRMQGLLGRSKSQ